MTLGPHVVELLPEYALGTLHEAVAREVEAHLRRCNPCARELAVIDDTFGALPLALPPGGPPDELRGRIIADLGAGGRFEPLVARVGGMLDLPRDRARELCDLIDDADRWTPGPAGAQVIHLAPGPRAAHANCGFVRLAAGAGFPLHRHLGPEHLLVLQGGLEDSDGTTLHRGDESFKPAGSEHSFTALPGIDLVYLVVLEGGLELPTDPGFKL